MGIFKKKEKKAVSEELAAEKEKAAEIIPVFYSRNMSLGINLLIELCKNAAATLGLAFDVEIIEKHHNQKVDAPSGTALMIANGIKEVRDNSKYVYDRSQVRQKREKEEIGIQFADKPNGIVPDVGNRMGQK